MIKKWKLFLEEFDPFDGDPFREEILNNVNDILSGLKDDGLEIKYRYGIDDVNVFLGAKPHNNFDFMIFCKDYGSRVKKDNYIKSEEFNYILHLHNYLLDEGFEPVGNNILQELDVKFHIKNKILIYPISRLKFCMEKGIRPLLKIDWIKFSYKLPFEKWKGNYNKNDR